MGTLIVIASLALISGLTFLAFKQPRIYRRVSSPLRAILSSALVAVIAWTFGVTDGYNLMKPYIKEAQSNEASRLMLENVEVMSNIVKGVFVVFICDVGLIPPLLRLFKKDEQGETPE
jgi:uncharacterized membrane protein